MCTCVCVCPLLCHFVGWLLLYDAISYRILSFYQQSASITIWGAVKKYGTRGQYFWRVHSRLPSLSSISHNRDLSKTTPHFSKF